MRLPAAQQSKDPIRRICRFRETGSQARQVAVLMLDEIFFIIEIGAVFDDFGLYFGKSAVASTSMEDLCSLVQI